MSETLNLILTKFTDEAITITSLFLVVVMCLIIAYWLYNRKKLHKLSHQIPASVVKNYLDSIIQNSNALKSSLFRGGGLDVSEGIPSVLPTSELSSGPVSLMGDSSEELSKKAAEINALRGQISEKDGMIVDLQNKLANQLIENECIGHIEEIGRLNNELKILKDKLARAEEAPSSGGDGDAGLQEELSTVTSERDELKERLLEYEIIEEDLANLKRLQQENEQLKASLAGGGAAPSPEASPEPEEAVVEEEPIEEEVVEEEPIKEEVVEEEPIEEEVVEEEPIEEAPVEEASIEDAGGEESDDFDSMLGGEGVDESSGNMSGKGDTDKIETKASGESETEQKSAEELLSEFEKMLG